MRVVWSSMAMFVLSSAANAQAALTGYVRDDESLRGLQGVELSVTPGDKHVRTDKEGKYTLKDLTPGANRVQVRFPGFAPLDTILTLASDKPTDGVFFLGKHAVALDTVTSRGARTAGAGFESFEIRRSKGFGRFMDSLYLRSHENVQLPNLLRDLGGVQIATPSTCVATHHLWCDRKVAIKANRGGNTVCLSQVVLDGVVVGKGAIIDDRSAPSGASKAMLEQFEQMQEKGWWNAFDLNSLGVSSLRGVEVYRSAGEAQEVYGGDDAGCGVVVLWTRRG